MEGFAVMISEASRSLIPALPGPSLIGLIVLYIDPGTGSFLFQIAAASLFGAALAVRRVRTAIAGFFGRLFRRKPRS